MARTPLKAIRGARVRVDSVAAATGVFESGRDL
jgi:hypothetical protein